AGQPLLPAGARPGGSSTLAMLKDEPARLAVRTSGDASFLVVSDTLVPGWRSFVDGAGAPLLRCDWAFRCVPVPNGEHVVEMRYDPFR
ncbi:MAG TPA: hypothetical protein VKF32_05200, partial [Thermoanaerobaculia bacterium]|nr:hypothetical protein [Thermoanaerobaculia bacterium]